MPHQNTFERAFHHPETIEVNDFLPRLLHHQLILSEAALAEFTSHFIDEQTDAYRGMHECSQQEFDSEIDQLLEWFGHLDAPGECPVCSRNGWIGAAKHKACHSTIIERAGGKCTCGKPATNTRSWRPICKDCEEHEDHLDMLCSYLPDQPRRRRYRRRHDQTS